MQSYEIGLLKPPALLINIFKMVLIAISIIVIAVSCAKFIWLFVSGPSFAQQTETRQNTQKSALSATRIDVSMLSRVTPFSGEFSNTEGTTQIVAQQNDAPETELDIVLNGVRADGQGRGVAFISTSNNIQKRYVVGEKVDGLQGVEIESIYSDGVLLSRNGRIERLSNFHDESVGIQSVKRRVQSEISSVPSVEDARNARNADKKNDVPVNDGSVDIEIQLASSQLKRSELKDLPSWARMDSNTAGGVSGVTVFPLNGAIFARSGLKYNDIVQSINDAPLVENTDYESLLSSLETANQVDVRIIRNGQPVMLTIRVEK